MSDKYNKEEESILQQIQNKTGCLFLVIGVAMLAFVLMDVTSSGGSLFGGGSNSIGSIAGEEVDTKEFESLYKAYENNFRQQNPGVSLTTQQLEEYKQNAWQTLVDDRVKGAQYDQLGLNVGIAEMRDLTVGDNPHQRIKESFVNRETNQFDQNLLIQFFNERATVNEEDRNQWLQFEKIIRKEVKQEKYDRLLESSFYSTALEVTDQHKYKQQGLSAQVVNVPYATISDSLVKVTDSDINDYLSARKSEYEIKANRDIEFVTFKVVPSKDDTNLLEEGLVQVLQQFKTAEDDSAFVMDYNSESEFDPTFISRGSFDKNVEERLFSMSVGEILGPIESEGIYRLYKIVDTKKDSISSVKASHIFFPASAGNITGKNEARKKANEALQKIRSGSATFEELASTTNYDATRSSGGDMGYLREGNYSYPQKLVDKMKSSPIGALQIVETDKGIHVAKATSGVSSKLIQVAVYSKTLAASSATHKQYVQMAYDFIAALEGDGKEKPSFETVAENMKMVKQLGTEITEAERRIQNVTNGNTVAKWMFNSDVEVGDVSDVIEDENQYIVAKLTAIREDGLPTADDVRNDVEPLIINEKKAELILDKYGDAFKSASNAADLAKQVNSIVIEAPNLLMSGANIGAMGQEYKVAGAAYGVEPGNKSTPIVGKSGVAVVFMKSLNTLNEMDGDMESLQIEMNSNKVNQSRGYVTESLLEKANVQDKRYTLY